MQAVASFFAKFLEQILFFCAKIYENHILSKEYRIAHHDNKLCFLPNSKCHIILVTDIED